MNLATANEYVQEIVRLHAEITRLRLTDAERAAVEWAVSAAKNVQHPADEPLRGLLERTLATHTNPDEGSAQDSVT